MDNIIPGLYLGNSGGSKSEELLKQNKITHILVVGHGLKQHFPSVILFILCYIILFCNICFYFGFFIHFIFILIYFSSFYLTHSEVSIKQNKITHILF